MKYCLLVLIIWLIPSVGLASEQHHLFGSAYIREESREIKSLSKEDIEQLKSGAGWGLAKPAELNGMPGPAHLIELEQQISLTTSQSMKVHQLFNKMKTEAKELGHLLVDLEKKLDTSFKTRTVTQSSLRDILNEISIVRSKLRFVHLSAHLKATKILTEQQIENYNLLRGYKS